MKQIKIRLDTKDIIRAIRELRSYKEEIERKSRQIVMSLVDDGVNILRAVIIEMNINDTGDLYSSVDGYYSASLNAGIIRVNCEYAVFVEFGTGTVGKDSPYPGAAMAEAGYKYCGGTHYFTTKDGRIGWVYPTKDGEFRFTEGLPSRPFMYETAKELRKQLDDKIKEVFA